MKKTLLSLVLLGFSYLPSSFAQVNDPCSGAIVIACGSTTTGTTASATIDAAPLCGTPLSITAPGVWYTFVGTGDAITASLCGSAFDTKIIVYSGSCASLVCVGGNDDACGLSSETYFPSILGTNYYILVTGYGTATGSFTLNLTCAAPCVPVPANDLCSGAITLTVAADVSSCVPTIGTNLCATLASTNPFCYPFSNIQDVWYQFNTGTNTSIFFDFDTISGTNTFGMALSLSCADTAAICFGITHGGGMISGLTAGTTYFLQVFNNGGSNAGSFSLCLSTPPPPPANDDCSAITPTTLVNGAAPVTFTGTTFGPTADAAETAILGAAAAWEAVTLTVCSDLQIDYCGTLPGNMANAFIVYADCPLTAFTAGTYEATTCVDGNFTIKFLGLAAGTYYLPVYCGGGNILGAYTMHAYSVDCGTLGILEASTTNSTLLYPNPASDILNITGVYTKETVVTITDALGKVVLTQNFNSTIDISSLLNGVYMVQIQGENYIHNERLVKAK